MVRHTFSDLDDLRRGAKELGVSWRTKPKRTQNGTLLVRLSGRKKKKPPPGYSFCRPKKKWHRRAAALGVLGGVAAAATLAGGAFMAKQRRELREHRKSLETREAALKELGGKVQQLRTNNLSLQKQISNAQEQLETKETGRKSAEKKLEELKAKDEALGETRDEKVKNLRLTIRKLRAALNQANIDRDAANAKSKSLAGEIGSLRSKIGAFQALSKERDSLVQSLAEAEKKAEDFEKKLEEENIGLLQRFDSLSVFDNDLKSPAEREVPGASESEEEETINLSQRSGASATWIPPTWTPPRARHRRELDFGGDHKPLKPLSVEDPETKKQEGKGNTSGAGWLSSFFR